MNTAKEIYQGLMQFTCTEEYHKLSPLHFGMLCTDGVAWLAKNAECYWLIDAIGSYQLNLKGEEFQCWRFKKVGAGGVLTCTDGGAGKTEKTLVTQEFGFTTFPLDEITFYVENGICLLTTER